jgi:hypothetical protein
MEDLQHFRVPRKPRGFEVRPLYGNEPDPPAHTLLHTRHRVVPIRDCFRTPAAAFPAALAWPERKPEEPLWTQYLRVQTARDDVERTDINDWLVWPSGPDGKAARPGERARTSAPEPREPQDDLEDLRDFFAYLFAQRRQGIFASNVSDRSYNVWLPPALLEPVGGGGSPSGNAMLAMLPFITLLRLPLQSSWRPTVTVTALFVPVTVTDVPATATGAPVSATPGPGQRRIELRPRPLAGDDEARCIIASLEGSTSQALKDGQQCYAACGGLGDYVMAVAREECPDQYDLPHTPKRCRCFRPEIPDDQGAPAEGWTIRKYIEAVMLAASARAPQTRREPLLPAREPGEWLRLRRWRQHPEDRQRNRRRMAASEVARSIRLTSVWSVQLLAGDWVAWDEEANRYIPAGTRGQPPGGAAGLNDPGRADSQVAGLPAGVRCVMGKLAGIGHLPTWHDRVDTVTTIDGQGGVTWSMPRTRCLLSVQSVQDDHFPGTSPVNSFVRVGLMVMAAAAIREMTQALLHETVLASGPAALAHVDRSLLVELEEVYGSDIVGPAFARFYRSVREHLDIDEEHRQVRERVHSLTAAVSQETNVTTNKRAGGIAIAAAVFAGAVLLESLYTYNSPLNARGFFKVAAYGVPLIAIIPALIGISLVASWPRGTRRAVMWFVLSVLAFLIVLGYIWLALHIGHQPIRS